MFPTKQTSKKLLRNFYYDNGTHRFFQFCARKPASILCARHSQKESKSLEFHHKTHMVGGEKVALSSASFNFHVHVVAWIPQPQSHTYKLMKMKF